MKTQKLVFLGLALTLALVTPAGAVPPGGDGPWMVRAWFGDEAMIREVAAWADHLGVHREKGFLRVVVDEEGLARLAAMGFWVEVEEEATARLQRPIVAAAEAVETIPGFPCYRTVEETFAAAEAIVTNHPTLATWTDIGDSWDKVNTAGPGYDIRVLKLTNSAVPGPKPRLLVTGAIHAREYTTAELATRFAELLVANHGIDPEATWLLDHQEVHLLLHLNPDGRKIAETGVLWRKNTNTSCATSSSRGVDLNRNCDFEWGNRGGSSSNGCGETYRGASPASEPEIQALQGYMTSIFPDQRPDDLVTPAPADATGLYLDLHSFSPAVLSPFGFSPPNCTTGPAPPNGTALLTFGRKYGYFPGYTAMLGSLSCVDGSTKDFSYGRLGVAGYTIEMGTEFFEECPYFESSLAPGNLQALLYSVKAARAPYQLPAGPDARSLVFSPPAVAIGATATLSALLDDTRYSGAEPNQSIAAGEIYVTTPPWGAGATALPMTASDGAFDENVEAVTGGIDTTGFAAGRYLAYVRGQDAAANWGPLTAAFLYVIDPATAPTLEGQVTDVTTTQPLAATVQLGPFQTTTDGGTGLYSMQVPSGTYGLTVSAPGYASEVIPGITLTDLQTLTQNVALTPYTVVFSDGVEAGNAGWTAQAPWAITTEASASPSHSWTDSPGGPYGNNVNTSLTSPVFDLSGLTGAVLSFRHIYDLESGFDFGRVEVSTNGGSTWTQVTSYSQVNQTTWQLVELPVPALDGQANARVRFRLTSDGSVVEDGWHLDDVELKAVLLNPPQLIFADGFESGDTSGWTATLP
ncbi:MAG TPA: M14 family zinc carboxypeptidase [Thermoanaerobaculia bacterium]|nr:M14 family zinc carboxypeptidase [Thermoanaerobaculia bacterium]